MREARTRGYWDAVCAGIIFRCVSVNKSASISFIVLDVYVDYTRVFIHIAYIIYFSTYLYLRSRRI